MSIAISVEKISKLYRLGSIGAGSLREDVQHWLGRLSGRRRPVSSADSGADADGASSNLLWALRDVSFDVRHGEILGIIGRNGAGKSTLLKILSRITAPTAGEARIRGRVGSLLEVGTGFHPDLTGRENVFVNGAILGMRKAEIQRKFDEIVDFSGIERFIDTPVKRYSSGMAVRLGFAVAAHLEPEILIIDEVLAVGDLNFQKKCLAKMGDIAGQGRTVLFVSHQLSMIEILCSRVLLVEQGRLASTGPAPEVIADYYEMMGKREIGAETAVSDHRHRRGSGLVRFTNIRVEDAQGQEQYRHRVGSLVRFTLEYEAAQQVRGLYVSVGFRSGATREFFTDTMNCVTPNEIIAGERGTVSIEIPSLRFRAGTYPLYFWLGDENFFAYDVVDDLTSPLVVVSDGSAHGTGLIDIDSRIHLGLPARPAADAPNVLYSPVI